MASKDPSVDIRDRSRIYAAIFAKDNQQKDAFPRLKNLLHEKLLFCQKPITRLPSPAPPVCPHQLGSLSQFVEHVANGYAGLPKHPREAPPASVRDRTYDTGSGGIGGAGSTTTSKAKKSNRGFYSSSEEDSDSDDSDSDSDSESESSSYDSSSSSSSDEEEEKEEEEDDDDEKEVEQKEEQKEQELAPMMIEKGEDDEEEVKKSEQMD
jgi:AP-3 complex subunit beta